MEEMQADAEKHYKSQIRSLGWGKITTLKEIRPLRGVQDPMKVKKVTEDPKPKTSSRRRRTTRAKRSDALPHTNLVLDCSYPLLPHVRTYPT